MLDRQDHPATALALPKPFTGQAVRVLLAEVAERPPPVPRARAVTP